MPISQFHSHITQACNTLTTRYVVLNAYLTVSFSDVTILVFSSRFDFDSIFYKEFDVYSIRFRFFRQEISYRSPVNLGTAMLNYSGKAGEAGNDSERSTTVARLYTRVHM